MGGWGIKYAKIWSLAGFGDIPWWHTPKNKAILNNYCFKRFKNIKTEIKTEVKSKKLKECHVFNSNETI